MKRYFVLILMLVFMTTGAVLAQSAWTTGKNATITKFSSGDGGIVVEFKGTLAAAADTLTSNAFSMAEYDQDSWVTYPWSFGTLLTGTTRKVSCQLQGSYNNSNWTSVDTLLNADSVTTFIFKQPDANNMKFPYYRLIFFGTGTNSASVFHTWIYYYRKDLYP